MNNYDYPEGADTSSAPWNEKYFEKEITVEVSLQLVKTVTIKVPEDYNFEDLKNALEDQYILPHQANKYIKPVKSNIAKDLSNWELRDLYIEEV